MQIQKSLLKWAAALIAAIVVTATLFHFPITIVNAVTGAQVPEFGIHVSGWRILFEPLLGILLYFNQSFYAIKEFALLLLWILAIVLIYSTLHAIRIKEEKCRNSFLFNQLFNLLLLVGIWFSFFVVMIFIPLPNNVIVNNSKDWVLVTTHSHTDYSHDGLITEQRLKNWHQRNGFDAFFITDHNNHSRTLEFVKSQPDHQLPGAPEVFTGEEFSGTNHLSLLGLKREFKTKGFSDSAAVQNTRQDGGAILVNHWFDGEHKSLEYYRDLGVDGFEIENTATYKRYDRNLYERIRAFCIKNKLIMVGGLDYHGYGSACSIWNAFEVPGWKYLDAKAKEDSILNILKLHDQSRLNVLLYNDRSYYSQKNLLFTTPLSVINYFRTLNFLQVLSWIVWILVFAMVSIRLKANPMLAKNLSCHRLIPFAGIIGSVFLLTLGLTYLFLNQHVEYFTSMYHEYSSLLMKTGAALLVLSGFVAWLRLKQDK
jgi:hypothetical protein